MSVYATNRSSGSGGGGVTIYPNFAAFPASAPNGTLAIDASTHILYEYNTTSVAWEPVASNTAYLDALAAAGAATSIGALDAQAANAQGLALVAHVLSTQSADATHPGMVNNTTQNFSGNKTFTGTIGASNLSGTNTGDVTLTAVGASANANGASLSGQALTLQPATTSFPGVLTAADWNTFNSKQPAGSYITALTGQVTASGPGSAAATIATNTITNSNLAQMATNTIKGNNTGGTANALDLTTAQVKTMLNLSGTNSGDVTLTAVGSSPNANAASLSTQALTLQPADGTNPGVVTATTQTFGGAKTFNGNVGIGDTAGAAALIVKNTTGGDGTGVILESDTGSKWDFAAEGNSLYIIKHGGAIMQTFQNGWVGWGPQGSNQYTADFQAFDANTNPATIVPNSGLYNYPLVSSRNSNSTANTFAGYIMTGSSKNPTGGIFAIASTQTASAEVSHMDFYTQNAGTFTKWMQLGSTGTLTLAALTTAGPVSTDSSGNLSSSATLAIANGGTGQSTAPNAINALLPSQTGNNGQYLTTNGTVASWAAVPPAGVTSVALAAPSDILTVSGSPVTSTGTLTLTKVNQTANFVFAGPTSGGSAAPTFRALVSADLPAGAGSPLTTKGDLYTYTTVNARHAVPPDYGFLVPDAAQSDGWRSAPYTATAGRPYKNYIQYADFENGVTTGWTLGIIGTLTNALPTGTPTFGSSASGNLSISVISTTPLGGSNSLSYASSAATTVGNMVASSSYAIDAEDQAKVMTFRFYYSVPTNPGNGNFSGTSSNSFGIAVWDVSNSTWLSQSANFGMTQSTGIGYATGTFQTGATTGNIRFIIYNANATAGAITLYLDDFYVGPQTAPLGYAGTDWAPITITPSAGFGTTSGVSFFARRIGDTMHVRGNFVWGTGAASTTYLNMPSGFLIDTTKMPTTSNGTFVGKGHLNDSSGQIEGSGVGLALFYDGSINNQIFVCRASGASTTYSKQNGSAYSVGNTQSCEFIVPIAGWSSNVQMSNDTDTRVVAAKAGGDAPSASSGNPIIFPTTVYDTHAGYSTSTGRYTVPISGFYRVHGFINSANATTTLTVYKNASSESYSAGKTDSNGEATFSYCIQCSTGDLIDLRPGGTLDATATSTIHFERLSGPSVVAATESVNGRYFSSTTTITSSLATVLYATKGWDTHGAYNAATGIFTAPVSGKYQFNASTATGGTFALNNAVDLQIQQGGSASQISEAKVYAGGIVTALSANVGDIFYCLAGDTIKVQVSSGATAPAIVSSNSQNWVSWSRVGN